MKDEVDAWRERYLNQATTILRVKIAGSSVHHLVPEERPNRTLARVALCDFVPYPLEHWSRVIGEDPCCQVCSAVAMRGKYWVRVMQKAPSA